MAAELYTTMESYIIQGDYKSEVINAVLGIPQGTRSAEFFCSFMADLPADLRAAHSPIVLFKVAVTCLMYMDDYMVPCSSPDHVRAVLRTLHAYGKRWFVEFDIPSPGKA